MRLGAGRAWAAVLMFWIMAVGAPSLAVEPSEQFFESLRESLPRYVQEDRVKTLALCLDFDRSTADLAEPQLGLLSGQSPLSGTFSEPRVGTLQQS